ncbi:MAG: class B sortase [Lachnospiraceae bacterium]|nr:class B sortase [Lachnospiraceae bacterium]
MARMQKVRFKDLPKGIKIRKIITWIFTLIGVACLGYFVFYVKQAGDTQSNYDRLADLKGKNFTQNKQTLVMHLTHDEEAPDILDDYVTLYNNNKSLVGWVRIEDTLIDYPVMQSPNEDYYLDHNFNQEKDNNGSIFIDSDCSIWPRSQNIIMYGHNMKSGKMFGDLKKYKNEEFAKEHPYIYFDTLYNKGKYQVMYVFGDNVYDEVEVAFKYYQFINANSREEWDSAMHDMSEKSMYETGVTATYGDDIITLSTCDYEKDAERFVVVAKRVK